MKMKKTLDYRALYENEKSHSDTLQRLLDKKDEMLKDVMQHNFQFTQEQKKEIQSYFFLKNELGEIFNSLNNHS